VGNSITKRLKTFLKLAFFSFIKQKKITFFDFVLSYLTKVLDLYSRCSDCNIFQTKPRRLKLNPTIHRLLKHLKKQQPIKKKRRKIQPISIYMETKTYWRERDVLENHGGSSYWFFWQGSKKLRVWFLKRYKFG
jgi:hypothetical protein